MADEGFLRQLPGLLGKLPWERFGDVGTGLLAGSGPSLTPQGGLGSRLGRAVQYAGDREGERALNEARRIEIESAKREQKGLQEFQTWLAANPDATMQDRMDAVLQFMPEMAAKGYAANIGNPMLAVESELKAQGLINARIQAGAAETEADAKKFELSQNRSDTRTAYSQLRTADNAFNRLKEIPGADTILVNPVIAGLMRQGLSGTKLTNKIAEMIGSGVFNIAKEDQADALSAVELISKARFNVGSLASRAVQGQANAMKGLGEGVGLDEQHFVFKENLEETKRQMQENEWNLPEEPKYPFYRNRKDKQETASGGGYVPGGIVPRTVQTVTVPAPTAPEEAPPATTPPPGADARPPGLLPEWMTTGVESVTSGALDLYNRGKDTATGAVRAGAPVVAGAVGQGVEAARPVARQTRDAAIKTAKDALATAQKVPEAARKAVTTVGSLRLNIDGKPIYNRIEEAQRHLEAGLLKGYDYVIVNGNIVDIQ